MVSLSPIAWLESGLDGLALVAVVTRGDLRLLQPKVESSDNTPLTLLANQQVASFCR